MWGLAAVILLRFGLRALGLGPRPPSSFGYASYADSADYADRDLISLAIAVGAVGLAVWLFHWWAIERKVRLPAAAAGESAGESAVADAAITERRSIVRSVYLWLVMALTLVPAAYLVAWQLGSALADMLNASDMCGFVGSCSVRDDAWMLAVVVVLGAIWAYHAWVRDRDVRQGPVISGAAAWVSRTYLYGIALLGVLYVVSNAGSIIQTITAEWARTASSFPFAVNLSGMSGMSGMFNDPTNVWVRPVVTALVSIAVWGAIWLAHWLYSNRLRAGSSDQSAAERTSRVRLAFLMAVLLYGSITVLAGCWTGLGQLFRYWLGLKNYSEGIALWWLVLAPPLAAVPAGVAWWWHRRRALAEEADGPAGVSARRVAGYLVALVGLAGISIGVAQLLATIFNEWFVPRGTYFFDTAPASGLLSGWMKEALAIFGALTLVGLALWILPWLSAQGRRAPAAAGRAVEIASSSRSNYLFTAEAVSMVIGAISLAWILQRYIRVAYGLPEDSLGAEVSMPLGLLLVVAAVYACHRLVLRGDRKEPGPGAATAEATVEGAGPGGAAK
jgi:hypothetical protein